ncbi:MAG: hypothetical protein IH608_04905 [Proteobacteria bacterium]|nr:hypothetical protein [Pseudomonadota bacterium]
MTGESVTAQIAQILESLAADLDRLQEAGREIPAVERNTVRMRGTLRALQVQFEDLARLSGAGVRVSE